MTEQERQAAADVLETATEIMKAAPTLAVLVLAEYAKHIHGLSRYKRDCIVEAFDDKSIDPEHLRCFGALIRRAAE
jgi:replicative superfamily II helicase